MLLVMQTCVPSGCNTVVVVVVIVVVTAAAAVVATTAAAAAASSLSTCAIVEPHTFGIF